MLVRQHRPLVLPAVVVLKHWDTSSIALHTLRHWLLEICGRLRPRWRPSWSHCRSSGWRSCRGPHRTRGEEERVRGWEDEEEESCRPRKFQAASSVPVCVVLATWCVYCAVWCRCGSGQWPKFPTWTVFACYNFYISYMITVYTMHFYYLCLVTYHSLEYVNMLVTRFTSLDIYYNTRFGQFSKPSNQVIWYANLTYFMNIF